MHLDASILCEGDNIFYQSCGMAESMADWNWRNYHQLSTGVRPDDAPCGYLCHQRIRKKDRILNIPIDWPGSESSSVVNCDGVRDCINTDLDERGCSATTVDPRTCDNICSNTLGCQDEFSCNGYEYGMLCDNGTRTPMFDNICDGQKFCQDGMDENMELCKIVPGTPTCLLHRQINVEQIIPIFNFTRCTPIILQTGLPFGFLYFNPLCRDLIDQTNCTDYSRVSVVCKVHGYLSTISKLVVCLAHDLFANPVTLPTICDNGLEKECVDASSNCRVHKHLMCDGEPDCKDRGDESDLQCLRMTNITCQRNYVGKKMMIPFPMSWVGDGIEDCINGEDEMKSWPTCGHETSHRYITKNEWCTEVFLCRDSDAFIQFTSLCDRIESCGNENRICEASLDLLTPLSKAVSKTGTVSISYCLHGLKDIQHLKKVFCTSEPFLFPSHEIFGRNGTVELHIPAAKVDCRYVYGEVYLYNTCTGRCAQNTTCPLTKLQHNSCPSQFPDRVLTLANNSYLSFLVKSGKDGIYRNDFFQCANLNGCITYDKVCDLVKDCDDFSDEANCTNQFRCGESNHSLAVTQQCDGIIDCPDMSDECNSRCGKQIIEGYGLKILSWILGLSAVLSNGIVIAHSISTLKKCKSETALTNKSFITLISVGDLISGGYLLIITSFDSLYGEEYCKLQMSWLTGDMCSIVGVVSTIGAQTSLFAMAFLSVFRLIGIKAQKMVPSRITKTSAFVVIAPIFCVVLLSFCLAVIPILSKFEDTFVNGIKYGSENNLFVGFVGKTRHVSIIQHYYGRTRKGSLPWALIRELVDGMFSNDYGGISRTTLDFYGNDGVCLFKYFVTFNEPQHTFVWVVLLINVACFLVITVSYITIDVISISRTAPLTQGGLNTVIKDRNVKLQRKISLIIATDFICWVPFVMVCLLHTMEVLDATPWYPLFSIVILPVNSVINPFLFDDAMAGILTNTFNFIITCGRLLIKVTDKSGSDSTNIEMTVFNPAKIEKHNVPQLAEIVAAPATLPVS